LFEVVKDFLELKEISKKKFLEFNEILDTRFRQNVLLYVEEAKFETILPPTIPFATKIFELAYNKLSFCEQRFAFL